MTTPLHDEGPVLGVWAPPADEAFLSAGYMLDAVAAGRRVVVVHATRGEGGSSDPDAWPPERLAALRTREAAASLAALGVREHRWLDHVDGTCHLVDDDVGARQVADVIEEVRPSDILTFGPDGMTGHPEHIAVSRWTSLAGRRTGTEARVLHATKSRDHLERFGDVYERFNVFFAGPAPWHPVEELAWERHLEGPDLDAKVAALLAQASQIYGMVAAIGMDTFRESVADEWFVAEPQPADA